MTEIRILAPAGGCRALRPDHTTGHVVPYRSGFYQRQLERGAVMVGVHIWHGWGKQNGRDVDFSPEKPNGEWSPYIERRFGWHACLDNVAVHPWEVWPGCSDDEITEAEYRFLLAARYDAQQYRPDSPFANPRQKVDWLTVKHDFSDLKGNK